MPADLQLGEGTEQPQRGPHRRQTLSMRAMLQVVPDVPETLRAQLQDAQGSCQEARVHGMWQEVLGTTRIEEA